MNEKEQFFSELRELLEKHNVEIEAEENLCFYKHKNFSRDCPYDEIGKGFYVQCDHDSFDWKSNTPTRIVK